MSVRPPELDDNVAPLLIAKIAQADRTSSLCLGRLSAAGRPTKPMRKILLAGCDRADSGHAAAPPPAIVMNSRRLLDIPSGEITPYHITEKPCCASQHCGSPDLPQRAQKRLNASLSRPSAISAVRRNRMCANAEADPHLGVSGTGIEFCPPAGGLISLPKKFPRVEVLRLPADAGRET